MQNPNMSKNQTKKVYSIYDNKAETFGAPVLMVNHAVAVRSFTEFANDGKSDISKYPADFDLYYLGEFNQLDGKFTSNTVEKITNGQDVKRNETEQTA